MGEPFTFLGALNTVLPPPSTAPSALQASSATLVTVSASAIAPNPFGVQPLNGPGEPQTGRQDPTPACTPGSTTSALQRSETPGHNTAPSNATSAFGAPLLPANHEPPSLRSALPGLHTVLASEPVPTSDLSCGSSTGTSLVTGRVTINVPGEGPKSEEEYDDWKRAKLAKEVEQMVREKLTAEKEEADQERVRAIREDLEAFRERHRVEVAEAETKLEKEFLMKASAAMLERKQYQYGLRLVDLDNHINIQVAQMELADIRIRREYLNDVQLIYQYHVFGLMRLPLPTGLKHTWAPDPIRSKIVPTLPFPFPFETIQPHVHCHPSVLYRKQLAEVAPDNVQYLPRLNMQELTQLRNHPPGESPNFLNFKSLKKAIDSDYEDSEDEEPPRRMLDLTDGRPSVATEPPPALIGPQPAPQQTQPAHSSTSIASSSNANANETQAPAVKRARRLVGRIR